ncbi:hypothetical protein BKA93DRAFT_760218 [Sparassis latifolia]
MARGHIRPLTWAAEKSLLTRKIPTRTLRTRADRSRRASAHWRRIPGREPSRRAEHIRQVIRTLRRELTHQRRRRTTLALPRHVQLRKRKREVCQKALHPPLNILLQKHHQVRLLFRWTRSHLSRGTRQPRSVQPITRLPQNAHRSPELSTRPSKYVPPSPRANTLPQRSARRRLLPSTIQRSAGAYSVTRTSSVWMYPLRRFQRYREASLKSR